MCGGLTACYDILVFCGCRCCRIDVGHSKVVAWPADEAISGMALCWMRFSTRKRKAMYEG